MLEKQHHQIPKQCSRRRAQQYPRADFGDFPNGALLFAAEQTVHNQCRYGAKEKKIAKACLSFHILPKILPLIRAGRLKPHAQNKNETL